MTYEEFMRGYEEYKRQRGAGGNSGAAAQWNGRGPGHNGTGGPALPRDNMQGRDASPREYGGAAAVQWNPGGQDGTDPASGRGISYDEFMRGYEEYKRQAGAQWNGRAGTSPRENGGSASGQTGHGTAGEQNGYGAGGWQGISFEDFMEGFYQQHPERRPVQGAQTAPTAGGTGFALGGQTAAAPAAGTSPQEDETPAGAQWNGRAVTSPREDGGSQAAQNRQLLAGLNWSGENGVAQQSDAAKEAQNRALQLTAKPAVGAAESGWTIESALAAAAQARQAAEQSPALRAARTNPNLATGGRLPGWSPEGRAGLAELRREQQETMWQQNPVKYAAEVMAPAYFWNGIKDGLRSAANGAAGLMAGAAGRQGAAQDPGIQVMLDAMDADAAARRRELMDEAARGAQEKINDWVLGNAEKSEQDAEAMSERFAGKESFEANLARWIGAGAGSMAPQIAAGVLGGPAASGALIFGQGMGDYYADALKDGATTGQAVTAGLVGGAANYGIEKAFGGIPMVGEGVVPVGDIVKRYVRSRAGRVILNRLAEATGEGAEEVLENYLKPIVQNMVYDKEIEWPTLAEQLDSFAGGFAASLVTGSLMEDLPDQYRAEQRGAAVRAVEGGMDAVMRRARALAENGQTRKTFAGRRAAELLARYDKGGADAITNAQLGELVLEMQELDGGTPAAGAQTAQEAAQGTPAAGTGNLPGMAETPLQGQQAGAGTPPAAGGGIYPQGVSGGAGAVSYDALAALPDMAATRIDTRLPEGASRMDIVRQGIANNGGPMGTNQYTGQEIMLTTSGLQHSLQRVNTTQKNAPYTLQAGAILQNAVKVNELEPRGTEARSDIYLGYAVDEKGEPHAVRFVVKLRPDGTKSTDLSEMEVYDGYLYSETGQKIKAASGMQPSFSGAAAGNPALNHRQGAVEAQPTAQERSALVGPTFGVSSGVGPLPSGDTGASPVIKVTDLLGLVKGQMDGFLSEDVRARLGTTARRSPEFGPALRYDLGTGGGMPALFPGINLDQSGAILDDAARQLAVQSDQVSEAELEAMERMAGAKGLRLRYIYHPAGVVDGWVSGDTITVNLASESGAFGAAVHEVGHTIKAADAGRFAQFEQAVLRLAAQDAELGRYAQAVRTAYTAENSPARASLLGADGQLDAAAVNEEVALKLAEQLVGDPEKLTRAVTKERGLGEMLLDFIRGIKNSIAIRLTGSQKAMLDEAERTLVNLLRGKAGSVEGQRMSVQTDEAGQYVKIENDILEGVPEDQWAKTVRAAICKENIDLGGRVIQTNRAGAREFTDGKYSRSLRFYRPDIYADKMRMADEIGNVVRTAENYTEESLNHTRRDDIKSFERGTVRVKIGQRMYNAEVLLGIHADGRTTLYDVVNISKTQQNSGAISRARKGETNPATGGNAAVFTSVPPDGQDVNMETDGQKDSLSVPYRTQKGQTLREYLTEQYPGMIWPIADPPAAGTQAGAQRNEREPGRNGTSGPALPRDNMRGRGTFPREDGGSQAGAEEAANAANAQQEAANAANAQPAAGLLASGKSLEIQKRRTREFVDKVAEGLGVPRWANREFLRPIAAELAESIKTSGRVDAEKADALFNKAYEQGIVVQDEMMQQYGELKKELRSTELTLDRETREGKSYNEWRKRFFGALNLTSDGLPVDVYYQELCGRYPELFDSGITHPVDQAERILEVYKSIRTQAMNLDAYYGDDAEDFKAWARDEFDRALEELAGGIGKVRRLEADNAQGAQPAQEPSPPMGYAEVERIQHEAKKLQRQADRAMARAALTAEDKKLVDMLLAGGTSEDYLRSKGQENLEEILKVYRARKAVEDTKRPVKAYNAKIKEQRDARAMAALEGTENWTDKQTGMQYSMETMPRNIRDISRGDEAGRRMVEEYFAPVQVHEAAATRMKNEYRARIAKLGLNQWESAYTQIYGELDALDGIKWKAKEREHLAEALEELKREHGREINEKKAQEAVPVFRKELDALFAQANQALVENGYEPIEYRKGYFPHFAENETDSLLKNLADLVGKSSNPDDLPTSIAGLTAGFKPGRRWNPHALERKGFETAYDALKGFDLYLEVMADIIHHTGDIRNLRALAEAIRYKYGDEGIQEEIRRIRADETLTDSQRDDRLAEMGTLGKSHLSRFVQELDEYTNLLAGKKSSLDRGVERMLGRGIYRVMNRIESKVAANMIALNPGSWLTNYLPVAQVAAEVGQGNMLRAARDTVKNWWHSDGFEDRSDFLTNRAGSQMLSRSKLQKASDFLSSPMQMIDGFASGMVTRAYYYKNLREGMNPVEALQRADRQAAGLMADRSKGALPTLFASKNPLTRMFTMYQVEVNNTLRHIAKDIPDMGKKANEIWGMILMGFVYSYIYNDLYELLTGRRCALDPLDIFNEAMGDVAGFEVPNLFEEGYKAAKGEASWEDFVTQPAGVVATVANTAKNLAQEVPFVGGLLGGGRLPVSAALPDLGAINANVGGWIDGDKAGLQALYGVGQELAKPVLYTAMPLGGGQLKKTAEGLATMVRGGYYKQGREGEQLQTAVDNQNPWKWIQAGLFGRSAIPEVGEYYDTGRRGMTAEQTAIIKELGMTPAEGQQWLETFGGRADNSDRSNFYQVRFGEEAAGLDERLARMAAAGAEGILPSEPDRTLTVDGEKIELGTAEYKEYLETRAAGSYELLGYLPQLESAGADDALQTAYAKRVQEYMAEVAREQAADVEPRAWVDAAREYAGAQGGEVNERLANAILARAIISAAKADKQPNGSSVKGSRKRNALAALEAVGFGTDTAAELWEMFG